MPRTLHRSLWLLALAVGTVAALHWLGFHPVDWLPNPLRQWWQNASLTEASTLTQHSSLPEGQRPPNGTSIPPAASSSPTRRTPDEIESALPIGLTQPEASGGFGIHRAVRHGGVWFPVFAPGDEGGDADPAAAALNDIELSITSGNPLPAVSGQPYQTRFEAIGGTPPYQWHLQVSGAQGEAFTLDPALAVLSGLPKEAGSISLAVFVSDSAGAQDSAAYRLSITDAETEPLEIAAPNLPPAPVGQTVQAAFFATGGTPPYRWSLIQGIGSGMEIDAANGTLAGLVSMPINLPIEVEVTDATLQSSRWIGDWIFTEGLTITTPTQLPPGSPQLPYHLELTAEGGTPPYQWRGVGGTLPTSPNGHRWTLSSDGVLAGPTGSFEGWHTPEVEVADSVGLTFTKRFQLPVWDRLLVVPSDQKAGIAWQPMQLQQDLGVAIASLQVLRESNAGTTLVYRGTGSNFVDRGLVPGTTYRYTLQVITTSGDLVPYASAVTTPLPMLKVRAVPNQFADPFADLVTLFQPLSTGGFGAAFVPGNVTGPPDGRSTFDPASRPTELASLHALPASPSHQRFGGTIVLQFTDNIIESAPGPDFTIFENVFFLARSPKYRYMEPAVVSVALFEGEWHRFPIDVVPPADGQPVNLFDPFYYNRGFAGVNAVTGSDPTRPDISGGDAFDLSDLHHPDLTWVRYIKIESTGHRAMRDDFGGDWVEHPDPEGSHSLSGHTSSGFDLDAVSATNY